MNRSPDTLRDEIKKKDREIKRLRGALEEIVRIGHPRGVTRAVAVRVLNALYPDGG